MGLTLAVALLVAGFGRAAEAPPADDARRQKAAEVERLQEQLRQAREDLRQLEASANQPAPSSTSTTNAPRVLEPLRADAGIAATLLIAQYQQDAAAADRRYAKRTVRVTGEVAAFEVPLMVRNYELRLATGPLDLDLTCRFNYPDQFRSIFTTDHGRTLVGRTAGGAVHTLHRAKTAVTLEGRCQGIKDGRVLLTRCRVVP